MFAIRIEAETMSLAGYLLEVGSFASGRTIHHRDRNILPSTGTAFPYRALRSPDIVMG